MGIPGNELADGAAKEARSKLRTENISPSRQDLVTEIKHGARNHLEREWIRDNRNNNVFLGKHKNEWGFCPWASNRVRRIEVAMARLRLGHTRLNEHMHRIGISDTPNCVHCRVPETIKHYC